MYSKCNVFMNYLFNRQIENIIIIFLKKRNKVYKKANSIKLTIFDKEKI